MANWTRMESNTGFQVDYHVGVVLLTELGVGSRAKLSADVRLVVALPRWLEFSVGFHCLVGNGEWDQDPVYSSTLSWKRRKRAT